MSDSLGAFVLAAGLGTRMRSDRAKVLHELGGEPMLARTLRAVSTLAPNPLIVVIGHQANDVAAAARAALPGLKPEFALQERQRGTGDAARCALRRLPADFAGDVLITYGDMPALRGATLKILRERHLLSGAVLSFVSVELADPGTYGRVVRDSTGSVRAIMEARDASPHELSIREINAGVYLFRAAFLRMALSQLKTDNVQGEYYLTGLVAAARQHGLKVEACFNDSPEEFAGINSREELAQMEAEIRQSVNRKMMAAGVTLIDPATAYIGEQVEIGADTIIGPNVQIMGRSRIGKGVRIEGMAWLTDAVVGDGCHLKLGVRAEGCRIGPHSEVGPFAHLRHGTELEGHNRIGNFVETKNARIGRGSKASHLSYLGDAVIGNDTNVGCGVITVNYDGFDKHQTRIGDRCMIGCDSQLVAPVTVGDDVYVASGTTILREVPDGALVMSHHPQREKRGWTEQWRQRHRDKTGEPGE